MQGFVALFVVICVLGSCSAQRIPCGRVSYCIEPSSCCITDTGFSQTCCTPDLDCCRFYVDNVPAVDCCKTNFLCLNDTGCTFDNSTIVANDGMGPWEMAWRLVSASVVCAVFFWVLSNVRNPKRKPNSVSPMKKKLTGKRQPQSVILSKTSGFASRLDLDVMKKAAPVPAAIELPVVQNKLPPMLPMLRQADEVDIEIGNEDHPGSRPDSDSDSGSDGDSESSSSSTLGDESNSGSEENLFFYNPSAGDSPAAMLSTDLLHMAELQNSQSYQGKYAPN